ncbi:VWA domain-containing protein [Terrabacter sp. Soil810]|uniref:VWA domain-containing protein n=1 Tax=Terrabacter sp. Soil810 TaxID=1736418 RepID=UPI00070F3FE1|nr:VWA domain-containing protein [Terrabacter sp. Soil810]KRF45244.1 magnesium chelatase [Terrabacter sp. Soil810]
MRDGSNDPDHTGSRPGIFPFSAVVGSDDLALALVLTAVSPEVGGVLVRGEKGTAKSTMVRGLAAVLPRQAVVSGCRFGCAPGDGAGCPDGPHDVGAEAGTRAARLVELPIGATEDRVVGSLDLERALGRGETAYQPGLLAAANRGILYVDEVNLLHDHLVDLLLDAAAMGRNTVERDGVSVSHAARIVLVGTMNPEEGELRPQLLDRFGLTVEVAAPREPALRAEVVRRRLAFDASPGAFVARFEDDQQALRGRIADARSRVGAVTLTDEVLTKIATVCAAFEVDGLRADIVTARAAVAHAAWSGRTTVTVADVRAAARLALPHRRRRNPFDSPGLDEDLLDQLLGDDAPGPEPEPDPGPGDGGEPEPGDHDDALGGEAQPSTSSERAHAGDREPDRQPEPQRSELEPGPGESSAGGKREVPTASAVSAAEEPYRAQLLRAKGIGHGDPGRRSAALTSTGRRVGSTSATTGPVHLPATIRAAAARGEAGTGARLRVLPRDLRRSVLQGRESNLVLLCVDASGSMAARRRMEAVKSAVLSLLLDAYQRRDKVGLVTFRGSGAELTLPPTGSVDIAARRLRDLPHGGRTPLAEGLVTAYDTLRVERLRDPNRRALLVVVTDGRATSGTDALGRAARVATQLRHERVESVVLDCESGRFRMGLAARLAEHLGAEHLPVGELAAAAIVGAARATVDGRPTTGRAA